MSYFEAVATSPDFTPVGFEMPPPGQGGWIPNPPEGVSSLAHQSTLMHPETWVVPEGEAGPDGEAPQPRPPPKLSKQEKREKKEQMKAAKEKKGKEKEVQNAAGPSSATKEGEGEDDVDGMPLGGAFRCFIHFFTKADPSGRRLRIC